MLPVNPIKYIRFFNKVHSYAGKIKGKTDLSFFQQLKECYELYRLNMLEPYEYYHYELFDRRLDWNEKKRFISYLQFCKFNARLNPGGGSGIFSKFVFKIFAQHFDLPVAQFYGLFDSNVGFTDSGSDLKTLDDLKLLLNDPKTMDFICKPIDGDRGRGIMLCHKNDDGTFHLIGEGKITVEEIFNRMCHTHHNQREYIEDSYLIEKRIKQHPFLNHFTDSCLHALRVITLITSDGKVEISAYGLNIGREDQHVSNVDLTGMAAGIDENGVLRAAVKHSDDGLIYYDKHPDSGAQITGEVLPLFSEALDLAIKTHSRIPQLRSIGWDIAITENGPMLIEGNTFWSWKTMQRISRKGLLHGSLKKEWDLVNNS